MIIAVQQKWSIWLLNEGNHNWLRDEDRVGSNKDIDMRPRWPVFYVTKIVKEVHKKIDVVGYNKHYVALSDESYNYRLTIIVT